jgi:hypothetical protein
MLARCNNPKNTMYLYYGGRGIKVAPEFHSFEAFFKELGPCPPNHSLDRKDNNRGYEPGNVRWATKRTQMLNRSDNRHLTYRGKTQTLREWSDECGISVGTLWARLKSGWPIEEALTQPLWTLSEAAKKGAHARWHTA